MYWVRNTIPLVVACGSRKSRMSSTTTLRSVGVVSSSCTRANRKKFSRMSCRRLALPPEPLDLLANATIAWSFRFLEILGE